MGLLFYMGLVFRTYNMRSIKACSFWCENVKLSGKDTTNNESFYIYLFWVINTYCKVKFQSQLIHIYLTFMTKALLEKSDVIFGKVKSKEKSDNFFTLTLSHFTSYKTNTNITLPQTYCTFTSSHYIDVIFTHLYFINNVNKHAKELLHGAHF